MDPRIQRTSPIKGSNTPIDQSTAIPSKNPMIMSTRPKIITVPPESAAVFVSTTFTAYTAYLSLLQARTQAVKLVLLREVTGVEFCAIRGRTIRALQRNWVQ